MKPKNGPHIPHTVKKTAPSLDRGGKKIKKIVPALWCKINRTETLWICNSMIERLQRYVVIQLVEK